MNIGGFIMLCIFAGCTFGLAAFIKKDDAPIRNLPRTTAVVLREFRSRDPNGKHSYYRCDVTFLTPEGDKVLGQSSAYSKALGLEPGTEVEVFYRPVKQSRVLDLAQSVAESMGNAMIHMLTGKTPMAVDWPQYSVWFCNIRDSQVDDKKIAKIITIVGFALLALAFVVLFFGN